MLARLWAWAKKDPVPALTLGGLVVYAILRLPYGIYYGTLGTSPEDVGLSYVETLARSKTGLTVAAILVGLAAAAVGGVLTVAVLYGRATRAIVTIRGIAKKRDAEMTDEEFLVERDKVRRFLTMVLRGAGPQVDALLEQRGEARRLQRLGVRASEQQSSVDAVRNLKPLRVLGPLVAEEARRVARRWGAYGAVAVLLAILGGLPVLAYADATGVRECSRPTLGHFGMFAVRGAEAEVYRVHDDGTTTRMLADRETMYLGSDDDRHVLFDCKAGQVVRLPAGDVLVASE